jgi:peptidoglycan/LPS O-acetylase OafA/YrhL
MRDAAPERVVALDALRLLMVLAVVVFHVAMGFSLQAGWWIVRDPAPAVVFTWLLFVLDGFQLPVLFFVAGYFAVPSLLRAGNPWRFLLGKARRLLLPLAVVLLTLGPMLSYIRHLRLGGQRTGFGGFLLIQARSLADWSARSLEGLVTAVDRSSEIQLWHLWFLVYLFALFALFAAVLAATGRSGLRRSPAESTGSPWRPLAWLAAAGLVIALGTFAMSFAVPAHVWWRAGPLFIIQPHRLPIHVGMFALGVFAGRRGFRPRAASLPVTGLLALLWSAAVFGLPHHLYVVAMEGRGGLTPLFHGLLRSGLAVTTLALGWTVLARLASWERFSRIVRGLSPLAIDIYLLHLPVAVFAHLLILDAPIGPAGRFAAVLLSTLVVSGLLGHFLVRRRPLLAAGLAVCASAALALVFP